MWFRRRAAQGADLAHVRGELHRILEVVDEATANGDPRGLARALAGDALADVHGRLDAYVLAGISVHPSRDGLRVVASDPVEDDRIRVRLQYRDRTTFLPDRGPAVSTDEPVELVVVVDTRLDPWRAVTITETDAGPGPA